MGVLRNGGILVMGGGMILKWGGGVGTPLRTMEKICTGFPVTFQSQRMECRLLDMRQTYERERLSQLGNKELEAEHRRLQRKIR